jgi:hypothetical protein
VSKVVGPTVAAKLIGKGGFRVSKVVGPTVAAKLIGKGELGFSPVLVMKPLIYGLLC